MEDAGNRHSADLEGIKLSRRQMLRGTALAAGTAATLLGTAGRAEAKMSYQASGYQATPKGDQKCANCSLFKPPSSCILVDGDISPEGWCRFYRKK
ncbi:MAG: high-potential iron-sulfur protein [Alphaproteobacteria bacterium]|nr:high-potential iron-sulfur protein [Alphaproteobacteria bacterium]MBV9061405.1 high-potential iron-sulfur protein [Alphaproteobacteria bacterium]